MRENDGVHFIDANVPIYAAGRDSEFKTPCVEILRAIALGELSAASDVETLQEIAHRYQQIKRLAEGVKIARQFAVLLPAVLPVEYDDMLTAFDAMDTHDTINARGAVHYAVMRHYGIKHIITADRHFRVFRDINVLDPRETLNRL